MARSYLTEYDLEVLHKSASLETGGLALFTSYWFSPAEGIPRWDLVGLAPDQYTLDFEANEYVPWMPLNWMYIAAHDSRPDMSIIGGFGSSKTIGLAAVSCFWCAMTPGFKFMDLAPVSWQSKQMFDAVRQELVHWEERFDRPTRITKLIEKINERPYPTIYWKNGSTQEFMSADEQGAKILSWSGDAAVIDEADKLQTVSSTSLDELIINVGSRLRGQIGGRERMGKLIVMANSGYDPELWARFDMAELSPEHYVSVLLKTSDNPYLTQKQYDAIERRIKDPSRRRQLMDAERPLPRGKEFTPELLEHAMCQRLDDRMEDALAKELEGYFMDRLVESAGVVRWIMPPPPEQQELDNPLREDYILVGDPGQSPPPQRNSAVIMVIKVTGFPQVPAELSAFWWGPTNPEQAGSYWPFIYQMEEWYRTYRPLYTGFDATGVQKGFDELVFAQRGMMVEGLSMAGQKMRMVVALKLILGKGKLLMPNAVQGVWLQLANWHMPDTKLRQDIASCLFMCGDVLNRLFLLDEEDRHETDDYVDGIVMPRRHADVRRLRTNRRERMTI